MRTPNIPEDMLRLEIPVIAEAVVWLAIVGNLQLALRHPQNTGASAPLMRKFAEAVLRKLVDEQVITADEGARAFADFKL